MSKRGPYNIDNKLKCDVAGHKGWCECTFFEGHNPDGSFKQRHGFKNVLTNEEVYADEPPGPTGDIAVVRHVGDAYRRGWDRIFGQKETGDASEECSPA